MQSTGYYNERLARLKGLLDNISLKNVIHEQIALNILQHAENDLESLQSGAYDVSSPARVMDVLKVLFNEQKLSCVYCVSNFHQEANDLWRRQEYHPNLLKYILSSIKRGIEVKHLFVVENWLKSIAYPEMFDFAKCIVSKGVPVRIIEISDWKSNIDVEDDLIIFTFNSNVPYVVRIKTEIPSIRILTSTENTKLRNDIFDRIWRSCHSYVLQSV